MHCYCFSDINGIILHPFILVSCLLHLLRLSGLCEILIANYFIFVSGHVGFVKHIQGVPGGKDLTSGECSLGQTIPI